MFVTRKYGFDLGSRFAGGKSWRQIFQPVTDIFQ